MRISFVPMRPCAHSAASSGSSGQPAGHSSPGDVSRNREISGRTCQSGRCAWGIATQRPELVKRLDPDEGAQRLINLMTAWKHEIMEIMGGMGINSIETLRGNRLMLRAVGLTEKELSILGVAHAGE